MCMKKFIDEIFYRFYSIFTSTIKFKEELNVGGSSILQALLSAQLLLNKPIIRFVCSLNEQIHN